MVCHGVGQYVSWYVMVLECIYHDGVYKTYHGLSWSWKVYIMVCHGVEVYKKKLYISWFVMLFECIISWFVMVLECIYHGL
jgi:hypothetical protein